MHIIFCLYNFYLLACTCAHGDIYRYACIALRGYNGDVCVADESYRFYGGYDVDNDVGYSVDAYGVSDYYGYGRDYERVLCESYEYELLELDTQ